MYFFRNMNSNSKNRTKEIIKGTIIPLMDKVMDKVLVKQPFLPDKFKAEKPIYAALVPEEIWRGSYFERRFVTPFGKVWETLAKEVGYSFMGNAETSKSIVGNIPEERLRRIDEILNVLEHPIKGKTRVKPNWNEELKYILEGGGELIPSSVMCDLYIKNLKNGERYSFELKAPLPNSDQTKVSKQKLLKLYAMKPSQITAAFFALPYNPYGKREDYAWSFPSRWFNMKEDPSVLIGEDFWDFIGGNGTYKSFIHEINKLGKEYRTRIYKEFLGMEPPEDDDEVKL
jgi:hypothetical protein